ncbi:MAG: MBL fold metallo-hydrolase [Chloroflexi bacterium]|nr:MBL fold metallo-hydrolase [Chloroflexota bacterium]
MREVIRIGSVDVAVARDSYWAAAPATHLRDRAKNEIPIDEFTPYMGRRDPNTQIASRVLCFVVKSQGKTILLDAGVGAWGLWRFGDGHLLDALAGLDVRPEEVDVVIPSHLHLDHIGWNTRPGPDGQPVVTFPNATYLFHEADWNHFTDPAHLKRDDPTSRSAQIADTCLFPVSDAGQMELITSEPNVTDDVKVLHTPGHTPGSVSVLVTSGGESAIFIGDVAHLCVQLSEYEWSPLGDLDRETSPSARQRVVEEAVGRNALLAGPHLDEGPVFGRMVMLNGRRVWQGVDLTAERDTGQD